MKATTQSMLLGVVFTCAVTGTLEAQAQQSLVSMGVVAGMSSTAGGNANRLYDAGGQLGVLSQVRTPLPWLSVRIDAGYQRLGTRPLVVADQMGAEIGRGERGTSMFSTSVNAVVRLPTFRTKVQPYAMLGGGTYWMRSSITMPPGILAEPLTHTLRANGLTAGAGIEAPYRRAIVFGEVRYQEVGSSSLRFVPLSVGLRLR